MKSLRSKPTLYFFLAWIFLHILINLNYPAREVNIVAFLLISAEILVLLVLVCIMVGLKMPFHPVFYLPLTAILIFFRLFRLGDALIPMYFYRKFNLYMDIQYVPDLIHLLYNTIPPGTLLGYSILSVVLTLLVIWGIWKSLKTFHTYFSVRHQRYVFLGIATILTGVWFSSSFGRSNIFTKPFFPRIIEEVGFIIHLQDYKREALAHIQDVQSKIARIPNSLDKLKKANVYIFFVESYGHTAFSDSRHFPLITPVLEQFEQTLSIQDFGAYSHFMTSATYGGASWLAHATIASGVRTYDQTQYNLVLNSDIKPLARYFNDAGYRTISVMPNTTLPWPEGEFFGYQKTYYSWDFHYQGPQFDWTTMPDQFVLDYIFRQEIQNRPQPLFIEYVLVSSHAPFHSQPPFIENWSQIGDGAIFREKEPITFPVSWDDLSNASEAYVSALIYDLRVLESYITQFIKDNALLIILGDHQPNVQLTGEKSLWSVPIHIISRNPAFLEPFAKRGYVPGMIPRQSLPHPGMETFLYTFLEDFSTASE